MMQGVDIRATRREQTIRSNMKFLGTWLVTTLATMIAISIVPGIEAVGGSYAGPIFCALVLAAVNASIKPLAKLLSLPITILTLGVFSLIINAFMLELASALSVGLFGSGISISSFGAAFLGSIVISLASALFDGLFDLK